MKTLYIECLEEREGTFIHCLLDDNGCVCSDSVKLSNDNIDYLRTLTKIINKVYVNRNGYGLHVYRELIKNPDEVDVTKIGCFDNYAQNNWIRKFFNMMWEDECERENITRQSIC